jgi:hypothetical protein
MKRAGLPVSAEPPVATPPAFPARPAPATPAAAPPASSTPGALAVVVLAAALGYLALALGVWLVRPAAASGMVAPLAAFTALLLVVLAYALRRSR